MNPTQLFLPLWLAWIAYWVFSAYGNKPSAGPVSRRWRIITVALGVGLYAFGRLNPDPTYFQHRLLPTSTARVWCCLVLTAAGLAFAIWARIALGTNWSGTPMIKEGHELIQSGPYRYVRHPIYTGLLLAVLGDVLVRARVIDAYILGLCWVLLIWKLKFEEKLMMRQFPDRYPEYRAGTKALIPGIY